MKVFKFSRNGKSYTVASETKEEAKQHLNDEYGVDIPNCFEIPESEWDNRDIKMYVDNDPTQEKFYTSIREQLPSGTQLLATTETEMFGYPNGD